MIIEEQANIERLQQLLNNIDSKYEYAPPELKEEAKNKIRDLIEVYNRRDRQKQNISDTVNFANESSEEAYKAKRQQERAEMNPVERGFNAIKDYSLKTPLLAGELASNIALGGGGFLARSAGNLTGWKGLETIGEKTMQANRDFKNLLDIENSFPSYFEGNTDHEWNSVGGATQNVIGGVGKFMEGYHEFAPLGIATSVAGAGIGMAGKAIGAGEKAVKATQTAANLGLFASSNVANASDYIEQTSGKFKPIQSGVSSAVSALAMEIAFALGRGRGMNNVEASNYATRMLTENQFAMMGKKAFKQSFTTAIANGLLNGGVGTWIREEFALPDNPTQEDYDRLAGNVWEAIKNETAQGAIWGGFGAIQYHNEVRKLFNQLGGKKTITTPDGKKRSVYKTNASARFISENSEKLQKEKFPNLFETGSIEEVNSYLDELFKSVPEKLILGKSAEFGEQKENFKAALLREYNLAYTEFNSNSRFAPKIRNAKENKEAQTVNSLMANKVKGLYSQYVAAKEAIKNIDIEIEASKEDLQKQQDLARQKEELQLKSYALTTQLEKPYSVYDMVGFIRNALEKQYGQMPEFMKRVDDVLSKYMSDNWHTPISADEAMGVYNQIATELSKLDTRNVYDDYNTKINNIVNFGQPTVYGQDNRPSSVIENQRQEPLRLGYDNVVYGNDERSVIPESNRLGYDGAIYPEIVNPLDRTMPLSVRSNEKPILPQDVINEQNKIKTSQSPAKSINEFPTNEYWYPSNDYKNREESSLPSIKTKNDRKSMGIRENIKSEPSVQLNDKTIAEMKNNGSLNIEQAPNGDYFVTGRLDNGQPVVASGLDIDTASKVITSLRETKSQDRSKMNMPREKMSVSQPKEKFPINDKISGKSTSESPSSFKESTSSLNIPQAVKSAEPVEQPNETGNIKPIRQNKIDSTGKVGNKAVRDSESFDTKADMPQSVMTDRSESPAIKNERGKMGLDIEMKQKETKSKKVETKTEDVIFVDSTTPELKELMRKQNNQTAVEDGMFKGDMESFGKLLHKERYIDESPSELNWMAEKFNIFKARNLNDLSPEQIDKTLEHIDSMKKAGVFRSQNGNKLFKVATNIKKYLLKRKTELAKSETKAKADFSKKVVTGNKTRMTTKANGGMEVDGQFGVVDVNDLQTATSIGETQNRNRETISSQAQINSIGNNPNPEYLIVNNPDSTNGAMVITTDGKVLSGNGRTLGLKMAYESGNSEKYKAYLREHAKEFGIDPKDVDKIKNPVLVRIIEPKDGFDVKRFVKESNESQQLGRNAAEIATTDAENIKDILRFYAGTEKLNSEANSEFIRKFFEKTVGNTERGNYLSEDGSLTPDGEKRVKNALLTVLYGKNTRLIEKLTNTTNEGIKNISKALMGSATDGSKLKGEIAKGKYWDIDLGKDISDAVITFMDTVEAMHKQKVKGSEINFYLKNMKDRLTPEGKAILGILSEFKDSPKKLSTFLQQINDVIREQGNPQQADIFTGKPEKPSNAKIIKEVLQKFDSEFGTKYAKKKLNEWNTSDRSLFDDLSVNEDGIPASVKKERFTPDYSKKRVSEWTKQDWEDWDSEQIRIADEILGKEGEDTAPIKNTEKIKQPKQQQNMYKALKSFLPDIFEKYDRESESPAPVQALRNILRGGEALADIEYAINRGDPREAIDIIREIKQRAELTYSKEFSAKIAKNCDRLIKMIKNSNYRDKAIKLISLEELEAQPINRMPQEDVEAWREQRKAYVGDKKLTELSKFLKKVYAADAKEIADWYKSGKITDEQRKLWNKVIKAEYDYNLDVTYKFLPKEEKETFLRAYDNFQNKVADLNRKVENNEITFEQFVDRRHQAAIDYHTSLARDGIQTNATRRMIIDPNRNKPQLSRTKNKATNPVSDKDLNNFLKGHAKQITKETGLNFKVVNSVDELRKMFPNNDITDTVEGGIHKDTVYLVKGNIDKNRLPLVIAHEVAGHRGVESLFENKQQMDNFFNGLERASAKDKFIRDAFAEVDRLGYKENRSREAMAKIVEKVRNESGTLKGTAKTFVNFITSRVRRFLRKLGFKNLQLNEAEVYDIAVQALRRTGLKNSNKFFGLDRFLAKDNSFLSATSTELDQKYPGWQNQTNDSGGHTTQIKATVNTYRKIGEWIKNNMKGAKILDASSGLGEGTEALKQMGLNIEDVEPYASNKRKNAPIYDSYDKIKGKYDAIISNAVLNVIPDNWRSELLHNMADKLNDGGKLFVNVRDAKEVSGQKQKVELDSPSEILVTNGKGGYRAYQKGFTQSELESWVKKELGSGYKVEKANEKNSGMPSGSRAVVITKEGENGSKRTTESSEREKLDKLAEKAGYNIKRVFHGGTVEDSFDVNRGENEAYGKGAYFTNGWAAANEYAKARGGQTREYYLNMQKPFDSRESLKNSKELDKLFNILRQRYNVEDWELKRIKEYGARELSNVLEKHAKKEELTEGFWKGGNLTNSLLRESGFDGIIAPLDNYYDTYQYVIFNPEQAKLADLETFKDGKKVPLKDRFNKSKADIQFSIGARKSPIEDVAGKASDEMNTYPRRRNAREAKKVLDKNFDYYEKLKKGTFKNKKVTDYKASALKASYLTGYDTKEKETMARFRAIGDFNKTREAVREYIDKTIPSDKRAKLLDSLMKQKTTEGIMDIAGKASIEKERAIRNSELEILKQNLKDLKANKISAEHSMLKLDALSEALTQEELDGLLNTNDFSTGAVKKMYKLLRTAKESLKVIESDEAGNLKVPDKIKALASELDSTFRDSLLGDDSSPSMKVSVETLAKLNHVLKDIKDQSRIAKANLAKDATNEAYAAKEKIVKEMKPVNEAVANSRETNRTGLYNTHLKPISAMNTLDLDNFTSEMGETMNKVAYKDMLEGQKRKEHFLARGYKEVDNIIESFGKNKEDGLENLGKTLTTVETSDKHKYDITRDEAMAIYAMSTDRETRKIIKADGGLTLYLGDKKGSDSFTLSMEKLNEIANNLTAKEKEAVMRVKKSLAQDYLPELNAVHERLNGVPLRLLVDGTYFPRTYMEDADVSKGNGVLDGLSAPYVSDTANAEWASLLKHRGDGAKFRLRGLTKTYENYVDQASNYIGMAEPLKKFNRILDKGMEKEITQRYGAEYVDRLKRMTELNAGMAGKTREDQQVLSRYLSNIAAAKLTPVSALKQFSSVPLASSVIPFKYLAQASLDGLSKENISKMMELDPMVLRYRDNALGGIMPLNATNMEAERNIGTFKGKGLWNKIVKGGLNLSLEADKRALGIIYKATKLMAEAQGRGSDKAYIESKFMEAVRRTQNTTDLASATGWQEMSRKSSHWAFLNMYLNQTQKLPNEYIRLKRMITQAEKAHGKDSAQYKEAKGNMVNFIIGMGLMNAMTMSLGAGAGALLRKKDDKKTTKETVAELATDSLFNFVGNPILKPALGGSGYVLQKALPKSLGGKGKRTTNEAFGNDFSNLLPDATYTMGRVFEDLDSDEPAMRKLKKVTQDMLGSKAVESALAMGRVPTWYARYIYQLSNRFSDDSKTTKKSTGSTSLFKKRPQKKTRWKF